CHVTGVQTCALPIYPVSRGTEMPRLLRVVTGDAETVANAGATPAPGGRAPTDRITTRYPLCPPGGRAVRTTDLPRCRDGRNTDEIGSASRRASEENA